MPGSVEAGRTEPGRVPSETIVRNREKALQTLIPKQRFVNRFSGTLFWTPLTKKNGSLYAITQRPAITLFSISHP